MRTNGHTILITGGGSGLGLALARAFIDAGNDVVICGRSQGKLDDAMRHLPALRTIPCDVSVEASRRTLLDRIGEHCPRLNVLVNNAAIGATIDLTHSDAISAAEMQLAVDLQGPVTLTMQLLPHLLRQPEAAVVNVTTPFAYVPMASYPAYCAAKAGLHSFSQSLRHQLKTTTVRVFEVLPPAMDTAMNTTDEPKSSPREIAAGVLRAISRDKHEIWLGHARALYVLARLLPRTAFTLINS